MPIDEADQTLGFLISLKSSEYTGESLARRVAAAISDSLPGISEVDVDFLGTIDEFEDPNEE